MRSSAYSTGSHQRSNLTTPTLSFDDQILLYSIFLAKLMFSTFPSPSVFPLHTCPIFQVEISMPRELSVFQGFTAFQAWLFGLTAVLLSWCTTGMCLFSGSVEELWPDRLERSLLPMFFFFALPFWICRVSIWISLNNPGANCALGTEQEQPI